MSPVTAEGGAAAAVLAESLRPPRERSSKEIRADIVRQRNELAQSVDALRGRVGQITDVSHQVREHRGKLLGAAVVAGALIGGYIALRRRRG
jgi:Protein of unknown function (DUF3618)